MLQHRTRPIGRLTRKPDKWILVYPRSLTHTVYFFFFSSHKSESVPLSARRHAQARQTSLQLIVFEPDRDLLALACFDRSFLPSHDDFMRRLDSVILFPYPERDRSDHPQP